MPVTVIDASALAAMVFAEPTADAVAKQIGDRQMTAPALVWFELTNVCLQKIRRHPEQTEQYLDRFDRAFEMQIGEMAVDHGAVLRLARETGLTAYDASYLWLARHLNGELITLDEELHAAAAQ